jgi:hypothetical protein
MNTIEPPMNVRVYLHVPFRYKYEAKELGCRWDISRKKWYCIDSDYDKSNVSKCIQIWDNPEPYKLINDNTVLLSNIPDRNRCFTL